MADVSGTHRLLGIAVGTALVGAALYGLGASSNSGVSGTAPPEAGHGHKHSSSSALPEDPTGSITLGDALTIPNSAPLDASNEQEKPPQAFFTDSHYTPEPETTLLGEQTSIDEPAEVAEPPSSTQFSEPALGERPQTAAVEPRSPEEAPVSDLSEQPNHGDSRRAEEATPPPAPPPIPLRKPIVRRLPTTASAETRTSRPGNVPQARHQPMSLGPAKTMANHSSSVSGYKMRVWSALARHKPRVGQRGSATVRFGINARGGLSFVQVSRSSGNLKLDQLALRTVRAAAPFASPPESLRGRPYTIRIDFN